MTIKKTIEKKIFDMSNDEFEKYLDYNFDEKELQNTFDSSFKSK